jgi:hypothetical protein
MNEIYYVEKNFHLQYKRRWKKKEVRIKELYHTDTFSRTLEFATCVLLYRSLVQPKYVYLTEFFR